MKKPPDPVPVSPTAKAKILSSEGEEGHVQLEHGPGTIVTVDLTTRRIHKFACRACPYTATWDVIDVVYDPNGACSYMVPVAMLEYKEPVH